MSTNATPISGYCWQSWDMGDEPPLMVNPKASLHTKIAWMWGEITMLHDMLTEMSCNGDRETSSLAGHIANRLTPVQAMMEHLGDVTSNSKKDRAA